MDTSSSHDRTVAPGTRLVDRYELHDRLATGGMAQVWRALDLTLDRWVAVKILHGHLADDDVFVARFRHEARSAARLNHRCIVAVYDTVSTGGVDAIVMELVRGVTLREHLEVHGAVRPARAVEIATEVADALEAAHRSGIIHRDVKPANIMLSDDGRVLVADFGIAKAEGGVDLTETGSILGTAKYVAPEQLRGEDADPRTDVYALGAVLHEMLAGAPPFQSETDAATALARLHDDPPSLTDRGVAVPHWLDSVVTRALERSPEARFPNAASLAEALRRGTAVDPGAPLVLPDDSTTVLRPVSEDSGAEAAEDGSDARSAGSRRPVSFFLALVLAVVACGVAVLLFSGTSDRPGEGNRSLPRARIVATTTGSFDPFGTGSPGENDALAALAVDGDESTEWTTEGYSSPVMDQKPGVGFHVGLADPTPVKSVEVVTPTGGWDATVHVSAESPSTFEGWGPSVGSIIDAPAGSTRIDVETERGGNVLVWFTKLATEGDRFRVRLAEIDVYG